MQLLAKGYFLIKHAKHLHAPAYSDFVSALVAVGKTI
jgi:hypothetical protein